MDVRDVARAHVLALSTDFKTREDGGGENRVILNAGYVTWRDILQAALTLRATSSSTSLHPSTPTFLSLLSSLSPAELVHEVKQLILCDTTKMRQLFPQLFGEEGSTSDEGGETERRGMKRLQETVGDCLKQWISVE
jgi:nucleoside-diphosphate-sugar epimerase